MKKKKAFYNLPLILADRGGSGGFPDVDGGVGTG